MKKLLAILFCVAFAAGAADARTLYVDAKRPNNNGNGLKPSTAKKTIQAAINKARKGDTILVYPGSYRGIATNNKKITIKSVRGKAKTKVCAAWLAKSSYPYEGTHTKLSGFLLDGGGDGEGIVGGQSSSCIIRRCRHAAWNARLTSCIVSHNSYAATGSGLLGGCTLQRCKIQANASTGKESGYAIPNCKLYNCLLNGNTCVESVIFRDCALVNCTVVGNRAGWALSGTSKFYNCILRNNTRLPRTEWIEVEGYWDEDGEWIEGRPATAGYYDEYGDYREYQIGWRQVEVVHPAEIKNVSSGNLYRRTFQHNEDPKFANEKKGNFTLRKGSPCINQGRLNTKLKKLVGTKDLAGKKRILGKAIDMGCHEY